ncbi:MAG: LbtU family siderophore porin [Desulfuromonas sp.]|nr:LbtU family siderophore porin [Desulfuromonas sp.]
MENRLIRSVLFIVFFALVGSSASARDLSNYELLERITALEQRLLEQQEPAESSALLGSWSERITLSGLVEIEASYESFDFDDPGEKDEDSSDIVLATVELGVDVDLVKHVSGHVLLLWEEDDTEPVDVDEAFITLDGEDILPLYLMAGKMYVPFGDFSSNMISDPLTLELGETRESAVLVGFDINGMYGSIYAFNGDIEEADDDDNHVDNFGATVGYALENDNMTLDVGICYINNLLDSDGLGDLYDESVAEAAEEDDSTMELNDYVGGFGAHVVAEMGGLNLIAEYVGAIDDIEYLVDGVKVEEDAISSWNLEAGYTFELMGKDTTVAVAYQGTDNAGDFLPESRYMACVGAEIFAATSLAIEFAHDEYETDDEADIVTAQLAIEF